LRDALAVADDRGTLTLARCRAVGGVRRESVHTLECAGVFRLTGTDAVIGVVALRHGRGSEELRSNQSCFSESM
jgi:hypothetical protein